MVDLRLEWISSYPPSFLLWFSEDGAQAFPSSGSGRRTEAFHPAEAHITTDSLHHLQLRLVEWAAGWRPTAYHDNFCVKTRIAQSILES